MLMSLKRSIPISDIDQLRARRVKYYSCKAFTVEFFDGGLTYVDKDGKIGQSPTPASIAKAQAAEKEKREVASQLRRGEDVVSELLLTDPLAYEEMLERGELTGSKAIPDPDGDSDGEETQS